jgi:hypothetical protein
MNQNKSMRGNLFLSHDEITKLYENEAVLFHQVIKSNLYEEVNKQYEAISNLTTNKKSIKIPSPFRRSKSVDFSQDKDWIKIIVWVSQIAVTCHLLQGCKFNMNAVDENTFIELSRNAVNNFVQNYGELGLKRLSFMLEGVESVRTEKILRGLGLFTVPKDKIHQLSLGSGSGIKDLEGMYSDAWIQNGNIFQDNLSLFKVNHYKAKHTILVDMERGYKERYRALNKDYPGKVMALNQEFELAIPDIEKEIYSNMIEKRNVVIAFRMDPVMIPDVKIFFRLLKKVTSDVSHFIMTIGSGNNVKEFKARLDKMNEIKKYLKSRNMDVYTIKLYSGTTIGECLNNPVFGSRGFATYEIIYCKIVNKKIH